MGFSKMKIHYLLAATEKKNNRFFLSANKSVLILGTSGK